MQLLPLGECSDQIVPGQPLPFGIRDAEGRLLLAAGQRIDSQNQLQGLLSRGAFVESNFADDESQKVAGARPEELPGLWADGLDRVARVLHSKVDANFKSALEQATQPVLDLVQRDPDLAILQIVSSEGGLNLHTQYTSRHAVHSAIAGNLAAQRLGWGAEAGASLFNAAMTMNLAVADLQDKLALQLSPLTAMQRQALEEHPERTVEMLQDAGVTDANWLAAVRLHHAKFDTGEHAKVPSEVKELAQMLQRVDRYTASFAARSTRSALAPDVAARRFYLAEKGDPMAAAIIKEFGIYPPGCTVRLQSGESGIVMKRGEIANAPIVAVVTNRSGDALPVPLRRDCANPEYAIAAVIPAKSLRARIRLEELALACKT